MTATGGLRLQWTPYQTGTPKKATCLALALIGALHSACFGTEPPAESPSSRATSSAAPFRALDGSGESTPRASPASSTVRQVPARTDGAPSSKAESAETPARDHQPETFAELERLGRAARVKARWRGKATYYSDRLAGNLMASGVRYRPDRPYAAHRTLPFGSLIRVVRLKTGAAVVLRVMDRGPFGDRRRIVDVSRAAAERLDLLRVGVADVTVELLAEPR
jgi:rare lipoprotein A